MKKNNYFIKREKERQLLRESVDNEQERALQRLFFNAYNEIEKEIYQFYANFATANNISVDDAKVLANKMNVQAFKDKAKLYVKTRDFSKRANDELKLYNLKMKVSRLELLHYKLRLELIDLFNQQERRMLEYVEDVILSEIEEQAGILGVQVPYNKKELLEIASIGFVDGDFSDNVWQNMNKLYKKLTDLLRRSLVLGIHPNKLVGELAKELDTSFFNARRILITEKTNAQMTIKQRAYVASGYKYYKIIAEPNACKKCKAKANKIYKLDDLLIGVNAPSFHPFCKCSIVPHYKR